MDGRTEIGGEVSDGRMSSLQKARTLDRQRLIGHIPDLRRYARSLTFNPDDADELLQDCLERALSRLHLLRHDSNIRSWAFTVMHNVHCNWLRRTKRRPAHERLDEALLAGRIEADHHASAELTAAISMLRQLSDQQREIITLIAIKGASYKETAERLDIPMGTVMSRLGRARQRLRKLIAEASTDAIK